MLPGCCGVCASVKVRRKNIPASHRHDHRAFGSDPRPDGSFKRAAVKSPVKRWQHRLIDCSALAERAGAETFDRAVQQGRIIDSRNDTERVEDYSLAANQARLSGHWVQDSSGWPWTRSRKQNCQWQDHPIQPLLAALVSACTQASEVQRPRVRDACSARERSRVTREHGGSDRHLRQTAKTASAVRVCIFTAAARLFEALEAV